MNQAAADTAGCRYAVRAVAAGAGIAVALLLVLLARYRVVPAALVGAAIGAGLWAILRWTFCTGLRNVDPEPLPAGQGPSATATAVTQRAAPLPPPAPPPVPPAVPPAVPPPAPVAAGRTAPRAGTKPTAGPAGRAAGPAGGRAAGLDAAVRKSRTPAKPSPGLEVLAAPRDGRADDLTRIGGIGPVLERLLNGEGIWHYDQIAHWKARDIAYFESRMPGFRGRITRDRWVEQARRLAGEQRR
ncbi:MAG: hypothetical protein N2422_11555 [Rhodobacteraceae bacterium]|nr:hypothetical protein [Paracoccaceae bacterium]